MREDPNHSIATCPVDQRLLHRPKGKSLASALVEANIDEGKVELLLIVYHFVVINDQKFNYSFILLSNFAS